MLRHEDILGGSLVNATVFPHCLFRFWVETLAMRMFFGLLVFLVLAATATSFDTGVNAAGSQEFTIHRGGNFTGLFQSETFNATRLKELKTMRDIGLDFIRLPIEPSKFYDAKSNDWKFLELLLNTTHTVGLRVIVDLHPEFSTQSQALTGDARYPKLLTSMAKFLKKFKQTEVALELMNEPIAPGPETCPKDFDWDSWQQKFYLAARAGSKDLTLVLTGACWGGIQGLLAVKTINDPKLIYSLHNYDPMEFTHQGATWTGPEQWYLHDMPYPPTNDAVAKLLPGILYNIPNAAQKQQYRSVLEDYGRSMYGRSHMQKVLGQAKDWAKRNHARIFLGEYGVLGDVAPPQDKTVWLRDMREVAESLAIPHAVWDFSSTGNFGPYHNHALDAGSLLALGLKVPPGAIPTPSNPIVSNHFPTNPVVVASNAIADFENGSSNLLGQPTNYFSYGQPKQPSFTAAGPNGTAPVVAGHLEFDYSIPKTNDYGGVMTTIPVNASSVKGFSHLQLQASIKGGGTFRVGLASDHIDTADDSPAVQIHADENINTYTIPLSAFKQGGWGKGVNPADVLRLLSRIEITATEVGTPGKATIDNISFVKIADATDAPALSQDKRLDLYNFELTNSKLGNAGGEWQNNSYEQNAAIKAKTSAVVVETNNNKELQMNFDLPKNNDWEGAVLSLGFGQKRNLQQFRALRLDLAATGTHYLRIEFATDLDTGNDNPQYQLLVTPEMKPYRIPIAEFNQAGWGKHVDLAQALQNATAISVYADTVGTTGIVHLDNVLLEK